VLSARSAQYYAIDLMFAAFLMIGALLLIYTVSYPAYAVKYHASLEEIGENALLTLAERGELHEYVYGENWSALYIALRGLIRDGVCFSFSVYYWNGSDWCSILDMYPYAPPESAEVVKVSYVLAGDVSSLQPRKIELLLWE